MPLTSEHTPPYPSQAGWYGTVLDLPNPEI